MIGDRSSRRRAPTAASSARPSATGSRRANGRQARRDARSGCRCRRAVARRDAASRASPVAAVVADPFDVAQLVVVGQFGEDRAVRRCRKAVRMREVEDVLQTPMSPLSTGVSAHLLRSWRFSAYSVPCFAVDESECLLSPMLRVLPRFGIERGSGPSLLIRRLSPRSPIHPVPSPNVAMTLEGKPAVGRRDVEPHGAVAIGARQRDPARLVTGEHRPVRMTETIAIAYRKYRDARPDRIEERLDRRRAAAMVRNEWDLCGQRVACSVHEPAFAARIDITVSSADVSPASMRSTHDRPFDGPRPGRRRPGIVNATPSRSSAARPRTAAGRRRRRRPHRATAGCSARCRPAAGARRLPHRRPVHRPRDRHPRD